MYYPNLLTEHQRKIIRLHARGLTTKQIALETQRSVAAIEHHSNKMTARTGQSLRDWSLKYGIWVATALEFNLNRSIEEIVYG